MKSLKVNVAPSFFSVLQSLSTSEETTRRRRYSTVPSYLPCARFFTFRSHSSRMDKGTPRWKNVPPPNKNTQVTVLGSCFLILPDGTLCVDLDSISLPTAPQGAPSVNTPSGDILPGKRLKFASRAPTAAAAPSGSQPNAVASYITRFRCTAMYSDLSSVTEAVHLYRSMTAQI